MKSEDLKSASADIRGEACAWIARLETGDLAVADIEALREWIGRSPRHAYEIRSLAQVSADANVLTEFAPQLHEAVRQRRHGGTNFKRTWMSAAGAAAAAVLLVIVALIGLVPEPERQRPAAAFATEVGGYLKQVLADGSTLELNTDSRVQVEYSPARRTVRLLRGEVLFSVAHDRSRPFVVIAGSRTVQAVGTAFVVRSDDRNVEIAVTEGTVRVASARDAATGSSTLIPSIIAEQRGEARRMDLDSEQVIELRAGQSVALLAQESTSRATAPEVEMLSTEELRRKLAWQQGLLEFSATPLDAVIREVARHTTLKIEIADPALRGLKFDGVLRAGQVEPLFYALQTGYGIRTVHVDEQTVRLVRNLTD